MAVSLSHDHTYFISNAESSGTPLGSLSTMVSNYFSTPTTSTGQTILEKISKCDSLMPESPNRHVLKASRKLSTSPISEQHSDVVKASSSEENSVSNLLIGYRVPVDTVIMNALTTVQQQLFFLEERKTERPLMKSVFTETTEKWDDHQHASLSPEEIPSKIQPMEKETASFEMDNESFIKPIGVASYQKQPQPKDQPQSKTMPKNSEIAISQKKVEKKSKKNAEEVITAKDYIQPPRLTKNGCKVGRPVGSTKKYNLELPKEIPDIENKNVESVCKWKSCGRTFAKQNVFFEHVQIHLENWGQSFKECLWEECTHLAPFDAFYKIQAHIRHHTKEKPFRCNVPGCKQAYSRMENLKTHKRLHTGEKPFACKVCGKRFTNTSDSARHLKRVHSGQKNYFCLVSECGKRYTDLSSLRKHFQNHHEELFEDFHKGKYRMYMPIKMMGQQNGFLNNNVPVASRA